MQLESDAIVCAVLPHGEHGAVVRFLTPADGLLAGYVRGGRSRALRPVLQPGNRVNIALRARVDSQLAAATIELTAARAALVTSAVGLATLGWVTALAAASLPEAVPHPAMFGALDAIVAAAAADAGADALGESIVRFELLLLAELGFGLDISACALTGSTTGLAFVSPRTGLAVSQQAAAPWQDRLLRLPAFVTGTDAADRAAIADGLRLSGHFLDRHVLAGHDRLRAARTRLAARWQ